MINRLIASVPGLWLFYCFNAEYLFFPFCETRSVGELLTFHTEERRDELRRDIRELDALIDDLITMARYDAGFSRDGWESVDLLELAKEECAHVDECEVNGNSVVVDGDRRMLQHLLRNLIDNARLHGAAPITVDVGQDEHGPSFAVRDAGPGIPESDRGKVFEPFFRGRGKQNKDGYGLGLPLVARIATLHGAAGRVSSHPQSEVAIQFA